jgi:PqqD family protein of HPr-rel-A system
LDRFQIKPFGAEAIVYDGASGDTHYLKPLTFAVFKAFRETPALERHLVIESLGQRLGMPAGSTYTTLAEEALLSLQRIGLLDTQ